MAPPRNIAILAYRFPRWRHGVDVALHWLERYDAGFILSFRFIYGVRNFSSFALGLSAVKWDRFLRLNFLAAGLWAASFVAVGFFLGHAFKAMLGDIARSFGLVMLGATWLGVPESLPPARRSPGGLRPAFASMAALVRQRAFAGYTLTLGLAAGAMFVYIGASSYVFQNGFGQ